MGQVFTERKAAGEAIIKACMLMSDPEKPFDLGEYRGFPMQLHCDGSKFKVTMKQHLTYTAELSDDPVGNVTRTNNASEAMAYIEEIAVGSYEEYSDIDAKIRKVFERGSFSLNGTGATILNDGSHRLSEMRVSLCVHYADSQDNKWYVMRLEFERESEDRFVGRLKRYDMDVYT